MKLLVVLLLVSGLTSCKFFSKVKDIKSNWVGLDRVCTVYSDTGTQLRKYEGNVNIESSGRKVKFELNGKRNMTFGGIVLCEEK